MKAIILTILLALGCGRPSPSVPWPGEAETEFLYWCLPEGDGRWDVSREAPEACETTVSRGEWDKSRLPLVVNAEPSLVAETVEAVDSFNGQLGFEMFIFRGSEMDPDITVFAGGLHRAAAEAIRFTSNGRSMGAVAVYNNIPFMDMPNVILHEIGHLVGLRHDTSKMSFMYGSTESRVAHIERQDIKALRDLYLGTP